MKIVIDTNIIFGDFRLEKAKLVNLCSSARATGNSVYMPEIVLMELINHFREQLTKGKQAIDTAINGIHRNTGPELTNPITDADIDARIVELQDYLHRRIQELGITVIKIPNPSHRDLISQDLARKKPFHVSGKGYRDVLIWENVKSLCAETVDLLDSPMVVLINDNYKDFCGKEYELHDDLKDSLVRSGIAPESVRVMKDIDSFLDEHIKDKQERLEGIKLALSGSTTYGKINFSHEIQQRVENYMHLRTIDDEDSPFPDKPFDDFTVAGVNDDVKFSVKDVRIISEDEVLVEVEAVADCEIDFFMEKRDLIFMSEDDLPYIIDSDWNKYKVAASDSANIHMEISLIVDSNFTKILSEDIEIIPIKFLVLDGSL